MQRDDAEAARAIEKDIAETRRQLAELEERARWGSAKSTERSAAMETSRDPEKGLTRLEHFQNVGRASPVAAFQTLVWAALNGDDAALSTACYLDDATRQKAQALFGRLPDADQQKFRTPESLAALAVSGEMMKGTALHIIKPTPVDGLNTLLTIRTGENGKEIVLPMRQGVDGWQFVVPERAIEAIERRMRAEAPLPIGKK
jgi:hypothetical protein